jgi:hypothetical protein
MTLETFLMTVTFVGLVYWGFCEAWQLYIAPNKSVFMEMKSDFQRLSAPLSRAGRGVVSFVGARLKRGAA